MSWRHRFRRWRLRRSQRKTLTFYEKEHAKLTEELNKIAQQRRTQALRESDRPKGENDGV